VKYFRSISLTIIFLLGISQVSLGLHFCHKQLESIAINELSDCCGMERHNDCDGEEENLSSMACCSDLLIQYDIDSSFKVMDDKFQMASPEMEILVGPHFSEKSPAVHGPQTRSIMDNGPPPYITYCSLILYA